MSANVPDGLLPSSASSAASSSAALLCSAACVPSVASLPSVVPSECEVSLRQLLLSGVSCEVGQVIVATGYPTTKLSMLIWKPMRPGSCSSGGMMRVQTVKNPSGAIFLPGVTS